jgi:hypothetical protein
MEKPVSLLHGGYPYPNQLPLLAPFNAEEVAQKFDIDESRSLKD